MKDLEHILSNHPKPRVNVTSYRQNLRRELLNSALYQTSPGINYRFAFFFSTAVATMLAVILALFVFDPTYPTDMHYAVTGQDASTALPDLGPGHSIMPANSSPESAMKAQYLNSLLSDSDVDQQYVNYLAKQVLDLPPQMANARPVSNRELYAVQKYRLHNGQDVLIYTEVPKQLLT